MHLFTVETEKIIPGIRVSREPLGLVMLPGADLIGFMDISRFMDPERAPCEDEYPEIIDERVFRAGLTTVMPLIGLVTNEGGRFVVTKPPEDEEGGVALVLWRLPAGWRPLPAVGIADGSSGPNNHQLVAPVAIAGTEMGTAVLIRMAPYSSCGMVTGGPLAMLNLGGEGKFLSWDGKSLFFGKQVEDAS